MAGYTFFHNPMSRASIAQWAFLEAGVEPDIVHVPFDDKPAALMEANPMGKIPTIVHHLDTGDVVVSEAPAICHYLAEMDAHNLLPKAHEKAAYFRWLFFASGPLEAAVTSRSMGWEVPEDKQGTVGYGDYDRTMDALDGWLAGHDYVAGDRFTMADVYVGAQVGWGLAFGTMPKRDSFEAYMSRIAPREAFKASIGALSG